MDYSDKTKEQLIEELHETQKRLRDMEKSSNQCLRFERSLYDFVDATYLVKGKDFFPALVRNLASALSIKYALVGEFTTESHDNIQSLSAWLGEKSRDNFPMDIAGTPFEMVIASEGPYFCYGEDCLPSKHHELLSEMQIGSFLGTPLFDLTGNILGILAAFHDKPTMELGIAKPILTVFAARAGAELERKRAEDKMRALNENLEQRILERTRALHRSQAELLTKHQHLMILYAQVELAKKQWEKTLDCMTDLVILSDDDDRIKRCNKSVAELAGKPVAALKDENWKKLLKESSFNIESIGEAEGELFHEPSGRWFFLKTYPFKTAESDSFSWVVVTLHDTTEIKLASVALNDAYAKLKASQATILQQEKMASIGQLAAGVAHEINNPIGFVTSNLGTLSKYVEKLTEFIHAQSNVIDSIQGMESIEQLKHQRKKLKLDFILEDASQLIAESKYGAERVTTIVNNLKGFSHVDEAQHKYVDINQCIEETLNIISNELQYKAIIKKEFGKLPEIQCYPQKLSQVFINLLSNAAQAIGINGEITISTRHENNNIVIAVSDNGCGIPDDELGRIFEPFFTTKEVGKGTGLGLSITYDIVKNHNGEISVQSRVGQGTTFTIKLPIDG